jgi:hypothetical protein
MAYLFVCMETVVAVSHRNVVSERVFDPDEWLEFLTFHQQLHELEDLILVNDTSYRTSFYWYPLSVFLWIGEDCEKCRTHFISQRLLIFV